MIAEFPYSAKGLWIVPSDLARAQLEHKLAWRDPAPVAVVWTWRDLWREVRERAGEGPTLLRPAAARAVLDEAIRVAGAAGHVEALGNAVHSPGFRKRLDQRIAAWTRLARDLGKPKLPDDDVSAAEHAIFLAYRRTLARLDVEDHDGLARWAANRLASRPLAGLERFHRIRVVEPTGGREVTIAHDALRRSTDDMVVSIVDDPSRPELFAAESSLRDRLSAWEFAEEVIEPNPSRSEALRCSGRSLFGERVEPAIERPAGVSFLGVPEGVGESLVTGRRVLDLISEGAEPGDVLVVAAKGGDAAWALASELKRCGVDASAVRAGRFDRDPALVALRLAMSLPVDGWDSESLVRLLRHGRLRPSWPEAADPMALPVAAAAVRESRAYRGSVAIRDGLRRAAGRTSNEVDDADARSRRRITDRASAALPLIDRLVRTIEAAAVPGTWQMLSDGLFSLAEALGLGDDPAVDALRLALEDHGAILDRLGRGDRYGSWSAFVSRVKIQIRNLEDTCDLSTRAAVRVVAVDEMVGVSARHVVVVGLGEGAFASDSQGEAPSRELRRFLRVIDSANESLTLVFPTNDAKGSEVLACGVLDEFRRLFSETALKSATESIARLDGVLPETLAMASVERRVRAIWRACTEANFDEMYALVVDPIHRPALDGAARALRLAHWRSRSLRFHRFDGRLVDPAIADHLDRLHGPRAKVYSPSQLESLASCPFQYYLRFVLGLVPPVETQEFDEDYAARGSLLHRALETLHETLRDVPGDEGVAMVDRLALAVVNIFENQIATQREPASPIERGLLEIEAERLRRTARRYDRQFRKYDAKPGRGAICRHVEFAFGGPTAEHGPLVILSPDGPIRIAGKVDRIDVETITGATAFRVIDYKSGHVPDSSEMKSGVALQLPLYMMAAERVLYAGSKPQPLDAAYWGLKEKGYTASKSTTGGDAFADWEATSAAMERYIVELINRLRRGDFPVKPRMPNCESRCDYRMVCRIKQARRTEKAWPESPCLGGPS